jgi:hypothetical protein
MNMEMKKKKFHTGFLKTAGILLVLAILAYSCEDLVGPGTGDDIDKLVDTWKVTEESSPLKSGQGAYWVEIEKHPDHQHMIRIYFFHGLGDDVYAEASLNRSTLTLESQVLQGGWTVQGSGEIQTGWNEIHWSYTADDGSGVIDQVTAVYTRLGL